MQYLSKKGRKETTAILVMALLVFSGCASYVFLQSKVVDPNEITASSIADKKWNAVRFETFGPYIDQVYGYVLYDDDVDLRTKSAPLVRLEKMTLKEALQDYDRTRLAKGWHRASSPVIREVLRSGKLVALTASDNMIEVNLWEDTEASQQVKKTVLMLSYRDLRRLDKDGGGGVPEMTR